VRQEENIMSIRKSQQT